MLNFFVKNDFKVKKNFWPKKNKFFFLCQNFRILRFFWVNKFFGLKKIFDLTKNINIFLTQNLEFVKGKSIKISEQISRFNGKIRRRRKKIQKSIRWNVRPRWILFRFEKHKGNSNFFDFFDQNLVKFHFRCNF